MAANRESALPRSVRAEREVAERRATTIGEGPVAEASGDVAVLQRAAGNRAAATLLAPGQAKLEVGPADDPFEREADDVADRVVAALAALAAQDAPGDGAGEPAVQRVRRVQRQELGGTAGAGAGGVIGAAGGTVGESVENQITAARAGGAGLPATMRAPMEQAFGRSFDDVKVHTGSSADRLNDSISAKAFTVGSDIFFKGGMPGNDSSGQQLLAHELTHVVQQRGGQTGAQRVQRNPFKNLFGKKKKDKSPVISGPTGVVDKTGETLLKLVQSADAKTRLFMARDARFLAKVDALEPGLKAQVMSLLDAALKSAEPEPKPVVVASSSPSGESSESDSEEPVSEPAVDPSVAVAAEKASQEKAEAERARQQKEDEERLAAEAKAEEERKAAALKAQQEAEAERQRIAKEDAKYKTTGEVMALRLPALLKYIEETPTWDHRSTITAEEKLLVQTIHTFAQLPGVASSLGAFSVQQIKDETSSALGGTLGEVITDLKVYVAAASANDPISLTASSTVLDARKKGNALGKMLAAFPKYVLKTALNQRAFDYMVTKNRIQAVIDYYNIAPKPIFQAHDGEDFIAWNIAKDEGWNPADFKAGEVAARIRNPHRFELAALQQLQRNFAAGNTSNKPLTVVLHAAIDHNAAFHRDPLLTAVITNTNTFTLLIEGGESLGDYQSQIADLAANFGVSGKIDQVMFAGHGNAQLIQMAGTIEDRGGEIGEKNDMIAIVGRGKSKADALFDEILANMSSDAEALLDPAAAKYRRILFNACLTNSNVVNMDLDSDDAVARQEITDYIRDNASLATYLANKAKKDGFQGVKSLGANASIGQVKLAKPSGELDLVSRADPFVTAEKLEYAEKGVEPLGVLRAALQAWAEDPVAAFDAMQRRVAAATTKWDDVIITTIYRKIIEADASSGGRNVGRIIKQWADIAGTVSEMKHDAHCKVSELYGYMDNGWQNEVFKLLPALNNSNEWRASKTLELVMVQIWLRCRPADAGTRDYFLGKLEAGFDAKTASVGKGKYVDVPFLQKYNLLTPLLTGSAHKGKTILALIALLDGGAPAPAKAYFTTKLDPGAPELPELPEVPEVPEVPQSEGPRPKIPAVPLVKGRDKVDEIPGRRPAAAAIPDLEELPELEEVKDLSGPLRPGETRPTVVAPGRKGRPKRDFVAKVPLVKPFIPAALHFATLVAARATEDEIIAKSK